LAERFASQYSKKEDATMKNGFKLLTLKMMVIGLLAGSVSINLPPAHAASAAKINGWVQESLSDFNHDVKDGYQVLNKAKGVLVFPHVYQGGFVVGAKYGEGALLVHGKTVDYYSIAGGSFGWQLGGQRKSIIICFMDSDVYKKFRNSEGWQFGADAAATIVDVGKEGSINSENLDKPVLAFVVDEKGLMANLSLEGTKISKIHP
jgi:lipid-binding SYLF domain-containing protein